VPRAIGKIIQDKYSLTQLDLETMSREITKAIGLCLVSISKTLSSISNIYNLLSSWFVNFAEGLKASLLSQLCLFGANSNTYLLPRKTKTV
jgi:hypothetical protein